MRDCFQHSLEGHSETSNDQALLSPFYHYIKMKAHMTVGREGTLYPGVDCPPHTHTNFDYVHRDKVGENVSSIHLKGFQKLQITRLFSIPFIMTQKLKRTGGLRGGVHCPGLECPPTAFAQFRGFH